MARKEGSGLTKQQNAFCKEYALNGNNGTAAYRKAYPKARKSRDKTVAAMACKLLATASIKQSVLEYREKVDLIATRDFEIHAGDILRELHAIAHADPRDIMQWGTRKQAVVHKGRPVLDEEGKQIYVDVPYMTITDSDKLTPEQMRSVVGAEMTISKTGDAVVNVKRADKVAALKLLGTYKKLFTNKIEHGGEIKGGIINLVISSDDANL